MARLRAFLAAVIFICGFLFTSTVVLGAEVRESALTVGQTTVRKGQKVDFVFSLGGYENVKSGINAVKGTLIYDTDIFATPSREDFIPLDAWESVYFNAQTGEFVLYRRYGGIKGGDVLKIRLTAKENLQAKDTYVTVRNLSVSEGKKDIFPNNAQAVLSAIAEQPSAVTEQHEKDKNTQQFIDSVDKDREQTPVNDSVYIEEVPASEEAVIESSELPDEISSGIDAIIFSAVAVFLITVSLALFLWKKRNTDSVKILFLFCIASSVVLTAGSAYALGGKGDLNGDGIVNYTDVNILQKHLVSVSYLESGKSNSADMNSDRKLTITDLSLLIRKIENTVDYEVTITPAMEKFHFDKQENFEFKFYAQVTYDAEIESITVNGREYDVVKTDGTNEYTSALKTGNTPGIQQLKLTKVKLKGGQEVNTKYTQKIDVLKAIPSVESFVAEETEDTAQMKVSFILKDDDSAIISSGLELLKNSDGEFITVEYKDVVAGLNEFVLDLEEDELYTAHISVEYNRSSDKLETQEDFSGSFAALKEMQLNIDYRFSISNLNTATEGGVLTQKFSRNQPIKLQFESSNSTKFEPERILIDGRFCQIEKSDSGYFTIVDGFQSTGTVDLTVEQVVLENGKTFYLEKDNTIRLTILKAKPSVTEFSAVEDAVKPQFDISFALSDPDDTLSQKKILIKNADGEVVSTRTFDTDELNDGLFQKIITLDEIGLTSLYTVQIIADCDLSDNGSEKETSMVLAEKKLNAMPRAVVAGDSTSEYFAEKGQNIELLYEISHNVQSELKKLVVNNTEVDAEYVKENVWKANTTVAEKSGIYVLKLTQLVFSDGTVINTDCSTSVEVLKSAPAVMDYQAEDMIEQEQAKFSFFLRDEDHSFLSGKIQLVEKDGAVTDEKEISMTGALDFIFDVEEKTEYTLRVLLTWRKNEDASLQNTNDVVFEKSVYMVRDYGLDISDITAFAHDISSVYFEPDSIMKIRFRAKTLTSLSARSVQMNGDAYELTALADDYYEFTASAASRYGIQKLHIEKIVMENGKVLDVQSDSYVTTEVLKSVPAVRGFSSQKTSNEELKVKFELSDTDKALAGAYLQISEENGKVLLEKEIYNGENESVIKLTQNEQYVVKVTADFDRDTNALDNHSNYFKDEEIFSTTVTVSRDAILFKDVTKTRLFHNDGGSVREIEFLDITGGVPENTENYYAVIEMENMPDFYSGIKEFRYDKDAGRVSAVLLQDNIISYKEDGTTENEYVFAVAYTDDKGNHPLIKSAEELFHRMSEKPAESYQLTEDLDASGLSLNSPAVSGIFTGELDGNGYKILNLQTSLFQTLSGATVHDLIIDSADITSSRSGILANVIQNNSVIENVFITNSSISNGVDELGAFAGNLINSAIRQSASVNISVKGLVAVGGIVGKTNSGAVIENCYVTGKVQGTYNHPTLGSRAGGIAGWHGGGKINYCFTQVQIIAPADKGNGGLIGGPNNGSPVIENSLSISNGAGFRIAGFDVLENAVNVYEYAGSSSISNITDDNQIKATDRIFDKSFYTDELGFSEDKWSLDLLVYGKRPYLQSAPEIDNNYNIPVYSLLLKNASYKPEREQAYANMAKLMPYSDIRTWIDYANGLSDSDRLVLSDIKFVLPLDAQGNLVTAVHSDTVSEIKRIRVVFNDDKMQEYAVTFNKRMGGIIAVFTVDDKPFMYQPSAYISEYDEALTQLAVSLAESLDYIQDIASITDETESRLYTDYYNDTVKKDIREFVMNLMYSQQEYPLYCNNDSVRKLALERLRDENRWKKLIYAYNYFDKWYRIDYRGISLSNLIFFHGSMISPGMNASMLSEKLLAASSNMRETHRTVTFYNSVLQDYTEKPLMDFLGDLSYTVAGYEDPSDWFADNFDGILKEQKSYGQVQGIKYRIWDILSGIDDGRKSIILPILTAPQEDMYLISLPSQLFIGSMNRYDTYLMKDGNERERMQNIIDIYAEKMGIFYGISSTWIENSVELINGFVNIQYDTRLNFPQSDAADAGDQDKDKTRDPVMKWVYEANNTISAKNGSAASADGTNVYWMLDAALGTSDYSFFTFSHETAHNQDGRYFYAGAGRRKGTGGEAHADGNIAQEMRDGCMVFNISKINDIGIEMTNNFSYERIDSPDKIKSYYSEMFETGYVLDYLAAQAFLDLTPQQQAAVAVQAIHTEGGTSSFTTEYTDISAERIEEMELQEIKDLWDNKISIRNIKKGNTEKVNTATDGSYGFESFYNMNWYQSHNDSGSPDTHSFKRLGMEMLGVGGYEDGYMIYMSALSESDLDALRKITGDPDITWEKYKLSRFQTVEDNLHRIPYFDTESVIKQFKKAFEKDAQNGTRSESIAVKRLLYGIVKRATGDFTNGGIYGISEVIPITSAQELIRLASEKEGAYYRIEANLDFSGIEPQGNSYISDRFIGMIDGNGYELTGLQYPLFSDLQYSQIRNIKISQFDFAENAQAILAIKTKQVIIGNVSLDPIGSGNTAVWPPFIKNKTDVYYEY